MMPSAASPPLLPVSNPPFSAASAPSPDSFRLYISHLSDSARRSLADLRPWSELADRSAFSRPDSLSDSASRLRKNLAYFRINYAAVAVAFLAVSLVTNPFSLLLVAALLAAWCLLYLFRPADAPLILFGRTLSDRETLGGLAIISVLAIFLTSVGSIITSALVASAAAVAVHGAFRVPEDTFLDEQEPIAESGLFSFLGGGAASSLKPGSAPVAARV